MDVDPDNLTDRQRKVLAAIYRASWRWTTDWRGQRRLNRIPRVLARISTELAASTLAGYCRALAAAGLVSYAPGRGNGRGRPTQTRVAIREKGAAALGAPWPPVGQRMSVEQPAAWIERIAAVA